MRPRFSDLREEFRPMFALAAPVVVAELGWITMGMVDTLMVGPLGAEAIGAVGLGSALFIAVGIFGLGMLLGLDTWCRRPSVPAGSTSVIAGCCTGVCSRCCSPCRQRLLLFWMSATLDRWGMNPEVLRLVRPYLDAVAWSTLPLLAVLLVPAIPAGSGRRPAHHDHADRWRTC